MQFYTLILVFRHFYYISIITLITLHGSVEILMYGYHDVFGFGKYLCDSLLRKVLPLTNRKIYHWIKCSYHNTETSTGFMSNNFD